jgi:hypothetical protein
VIPQPGIFQHVAVGIDGALVFQVVDGTRIEYRPHDRSSL